MPSAATQALITRHLSFTRRLKGGSFLYARSSVSSNQNCAPLLSSSRPKWPTASYDGASPELDREGVPDRGRRICFLS